MAAPTFLWRDSAETATAWRIDLQSELVFVGDEGTTEIRGPSRRQGFEVAARGQVWGPLYVNGSFTWTHAEFRNGDAIPLAPEYIAYHDKEWGFPVRDDRRLFEFLVLEGAQAGLSWRTVLARRDRYRAAFRGFDPAKVARFGAREVARLLSDPGLIRNRLKIEGAVENARRLLSVRREFGTFDAYLWSFVGGAPKVNSWRQMKEVPAKTAESDALSRDLQRRGFRFVGPTIVYAFMQAVGMVNDHLVTCHRHAAVSKLARKR